MPDIFSFAKGDSSIPNIIKEETTYELTPQGKTEARSLAGGDKNLMVLAAIAEREPCTIKEIRKLTHYSHKEIIQIMGELIRKRHVRVSGGRLAEGAMQ